MIEKVHAIIFRFYGQNQLIDLCSMIHGFFFSLINTENQEKLDDICSWLVFHCWWYENLIALQIIHTPFSNSSDYMYLSKCYTSLLFLSYLILLTMVKSRSEVVNVVLSRLLCFFFTLSFRWQWLSSVILSFFLTEIKRKHHTKVLLPYVVLENDEDKKKRSKHMVTPLYHWN